VYFIYSIFFKKRKDKKPLKALKLLKVFYALGIEAFVEAPRRERLPKARPLW